MNVIEAKKIEPQPCRAVTGRRRIAYELGAYLTDESRTAAGAVEAVFFPENREQLCGAIRRCADKGMKITVAGARTGIVGGAVPLESEAVISMERMNRVDGLCFRDRHGGRLFIKVGAGLVLSELQEALRNTRPQELPWHDRGSMGPGLKMLESRTVRPFYPVDPTEVSAQIGGTIATNASGARSYFYGATREWVESLTVLTAGGELIELRRGQCVSENRRFLLRRPDGSETKIIIPELNLPSTKNTAGYHINRGPVDAVDLFIGSEGTLGIIAGAELRLTFEPPERLFATVFLPGEAGAVDMVEKLRGLDGVTVLAIEYLDPGALSLLRERREQSGASSDVPQLPREAGCALYVETAFESDEGFRACYDRLTPLIGSAGGSAARTWAGTSASQMRAMKAFRHAVPESVNSIVAARKRNDPAIHKIGTDMAVPDICLRDTIAMYRDELDRSGLEHVIFGHIGDNHLHVNILPSSGADVERAMHIYELFAARVVSAGGSVSAEHGIGRLKKGLLRLQYSKDELAGMERIKDAFDPHGLLNIGVVF